MIFQFLWCFFWGMHYKAGKGEKWMYLIFLDTETTGVNPDIHRIVEIAYKVIDSITGKPVISYDSVVAQSREVWANVDPSSLEIHGLTFEEVLNGKSERAIAAEITNDLNKLGLKEKGGVFICQNPSFDRIFFLQMIDAELQDSYGWPYHWLDLASMYWAIRIKSDPNALKDFNESDLSKDAIALYCGLKEEEWPHRAMNGVNHLIECYEALFGKLVPSISGA
jgi:oligoribonuclease